MTKQRKPLDLAARHTGAVYLIRPVIDSKVCEPSAVAGRQTNSSAKAAAVARTVIGDDPREHFVVLLLDNKHRVRTVQVVSIGTVGSSLVHPREVFALAVGAGATAVIVAHNHPSGDPTPSVEDRDVTTRLIAAGKVLGIPVLDHVVIAGGADGDAFWSFRERSPMLFAD